MKEYTFQFANQRYLIRLLFSCFALLIILLIFSVSILINAIGIFGCMAIAFGFPVALFLFLKKNIKKEGSVGIGLDHAEFKLNATTEKILFSDIKFYTIQQYKGVRLVIEQKNKKKFSVQANPNFCDTTGFKLSCSELDKALQHYKSTYQADLVRKKAW